MSVGRVVGFLACPRVLLPWAVPVCVKKLDVYVFRVFVCINIKPQHLRKARSGRLFVNVGFANVVTVSIGYAVLGVMDCSNRD